MAEIDTKRGERCMQHYYMEKCGLPKRCVLNADHASRCVLNWSECLCIVLGFDEETRRVTLMERYRC